MESPLHLSTTKATTYTLSTISNAPNRHFFNRFQPTRQCFRTRPLTRISNKTGSVPFASLSTSSILSRSLYAALPLQIRCRVTCVLISAASFRTSGGNGVGDVGDGNGGGGGGDGDGGLEGGESKSKLGGGGGEEVAPSSSEVILLDVGGMTCGGCAASVKRILESQAQVSSASVNLTSETAIVWILSEAKVIPNWQKQLGEELAKHLTNCGFKSNVRGELQQLLGVDYWDGNPVAGKLISPVQFVSPRSKFDNFLLIDRN